MRISYGITLFLAAIGVLYNSFSLASLLAFAFIAISSAPLFLLSLDLQESATPEQRAAGQSSWSLPGVFFCLSVLNVLVVVWGNGFRLVDVLSGDGVLAIAGQATAERYGFGSTQGNALLLSAAIASAFVWARSSAPALAAMLAALVPAALYALLSTEKWPFFCAMSFFVAGLLMSDRRRGTYRHALVAAVCAVAVGILSLGIRQGMTGSDAGFEVLTGLLSLLAHYVFAQYEAFGRWLMSDFGECCSLGRYTFSGPVSLLGLAERAPGVFPEIETVRGLETNIYTAWRYLAQDFSIAGPVVIVSLFAASYRYCWLAGHRRIAKGMLTLLLISTFLQINTTIFVHNAVALAAAFCALLVLRPMQHGELADA